MFTNDYGRIAEAIRFLEKNFKRQPGLDEIAEAVNLSKFHFSRLFKRWAGISPVQFLHFLTLEYTRKQLAASKSLLDTSLEAGLSGPGRLHDLFVNLSAMTPGEFKNKGRGLRITYGFTGTPFGECILALTDRGICHLGFMDSAGKSEYLQSFKKEWINAELLEDAEKILPVIKKIFPRQSAARTETFINLHVRGTNFQINVWKALLSIPEGNLVSYSQVAEAIGSPGATRAVANAVASNPVGFLIPCHRVISKSGCFNKYRWGTERKKALAGWEAAQLSSNQDV